MDHFVSKQWQNKWEKESAVNTKTLMKSEDKARKPPPFHRHHLSSLSRARANAIAFYSLLFDFMVVGRAVGRSRSVREHSNGIRWRNDDKPMSQWGRNSTIMKSSLQQRLKWLLGPWALSCIGKVFMLNTTFDQIATTSEL